MRALVVDDQPANLVLGEAILKKLGFNVVLASGGIEACGLFQIGMFDIILTDYNMPDMNGAELTTAIRKIEQVESRTPSMIVAVSAAPTDEVRQDLMLAGIDKFLPKPMRFADMSGIIKACIEKVTPHKVDT